MAAKSCCTVIRASVGRTATPEIAQSTEADRVQSMTTAPAGVFGPSVEPFPRMFVAVPPPSLYWLHRCVCPAPGFPVGVPAPVDRNATASTTHASSVTVVTATLGVTLVPVAPFCASTGVVWSTPVREIAPVAAFADAERVTTTLFDPVAGAIRYRSSDRTLPANVSARTNVRAAPEYVIDVTVWPTSVRIVTPTMRSRFAPLTVWANVKLAALPEVLLLASKAIVLVRASRRQR